MEGKGKSQEERRKAPGLQTDLEEGEGRNGDTWKGDTTTNQSVLSTDCMQPLGRQTTEMEGPIGDGRFGTAEGKSRVASSGQG